MIASDIQTESLHPHSDTPPPFDPPRLEHLDHPPARLILRSEAEGLASRMTRRAEDAEPSAPTDEARAEKAAPRKRRAHANDIWTTERTEQLKIHFEAGLSCRQIASQIGVTRNAVIGKLNRLGLSRGRGAAGAPERTGPRTRRRGALTQRHILQAVFAEAPPPAVEELVASAERCTLLELAAGKCRWPLTDPDAKDFFFCGNRSVAGLSYCAGHARLAYRTPARRYARSA
jgi:GcrA cell cycle regulator